MTNHFLPISVKGIVFDQDKVWLRKNERNEWEIPGGKLEANEQPEQTVVRELKEELGFEVKVINIIQSHLYTIAASPDEQKGVLVVTYLCKILENNDEKEFNGEAGPAIFKRFSISDLSSLNIPEFYKIAIKKACSEYRNNPGI